MEKKKEVSRAVVQRIPRYFRYISELKAEGVQRISSRALAERMGLTASQIRQDFNCFGGFGQQGYGYNVEKLHEELADILGLNLSRTAVLVGVGNIGRALIKNFRFGESGFRLLCAFDTDKTIIGTEPGGVTVRDSSELYDYVSQHKPDIAVLTVPRGLAPDMARELVSRGIKGLWNFTGEDLHLEGLGVPVENVHFSDSLMTLCYQVDEAEQNKA
ncbi:redox-sensing transcriptional repressor Rex [Intestinibacillus massiliensis]|uniref:redox-sensing transcriptional repressor Rex n=1 Tax=Intestinibacillus massiliensis TaxID=1871029 RepID=UPI000B35ADB9|nr:redox-sensing transcriptional repressor Rex [Intestinibacillus massiliensis]MCB6367035.1 redox-sensing transcriptional repressor Rex [Intestinibacillus massiliensis]